MTDRPWTAQDVPDQHGRTAVVTGANTGLGLVTARVLAKSGAEVVLACRAPTRADAAARAIRAAVPGAVLHTLPLDLASQASVRAAAERLRADHERIDLLVNNAGVYGTRERTVTGDGFETTFATNHLGVFALTGLVLDRLLAAPGSRVVTVSSLAHRSAVLDLDDLQSEHRYRRLTAYGRSKLANLLFARELQARLAAAGAPVLSLAAHPGQSRTEFTRDLGPVGRLLYDQRARAVTGLVMQDVEVGALTTLRAATDPGAAGGECYGPSGPLQLTGHPARVPTSARSHDAATRQVLWERSEALTGVQPLPRAAQPATVTGPGDPGDPSGAGAPLAAGRPAP